MLHDLQAELEVDQREKTPLVTQKAEGSRCVEVVGWRCFTRLLVVGLAAPSGMAVRYIASGCSALLRSIHISPSGGPPSAQSVQAALNLRDERRAF